jgi:hypothetical protein
LSHREELEVALAEAEARLAEAVEVRARLDTDAAEANSRIERARALCRHARAALIELDHAELERAKSSTVGLEIGTRPPALGAPRSARRARRRGIHRLVGGLLAREFAGKSDPNLKLLVRQSIMLLALVLAYLQYYFFDVHLQIARLPTIAMRLLNLRHPFL